MLKLPGALNPRMFTALAYPAPVGENTWVKGLRLNTSSSEVACVFFRKACEVTLIE